MGIIGVSAYADIRVPSTISPAEMAPGDRDLREDSILVRGKAGVAANVLLPR